MSQHTCSFRFMPLAALTLSVCLGATQAQNAKSGGTFRVIRDAGSLAALNLNPFAAPSKRLYPTTSAIYEPLFYINALNGNAEAILGTKYAWSKDNLSLTVSTRPGVKWSDGAAFSAEDVAFTFNYLKKYPALDTSGIWQSGLKAVKASGPNSVVLTFGKLNTAILPYVVQQPIVPQHVWSKVSDPVTFTNDKPVATGPFVFDSYSPQSIRVVKNPNYWMKGRPYVDAVVWDIVGGTDALLLKMLRGDGDFSYANVPDVQQTYINKNPATNVIFWPVANSNFLYFNTAKAPFGDVNFRRALALAIDKKDVALKAYAGLLGPADNTGVIPTQAGKWLEASTKQAAGAYDKFDLGAAKAALAKAGYKTDASGALLGKDGKKLPTMNILVGAGWVDFIAMAQVVSDNFKKLGISANIDQQNWSSYSGSLATGSYDLAISWGWGSGETPYNVYYTSFSPEFSAKVGAAADSNWSRYTNPQVTSALATFRSTSNFAAQKKAVQTIAKAVATDLPWIGLTERVEFGTYNTSRFTGFPTKQNPYYAATADDTLGARSLFINVHLK